MEPAGIAIGLGGILLAFKGVVDTVNLFDLIVSKDNGSKHLALRYSVERHKTTLWADEFQPDAGASSPLAHESNATRRLIAGVLSEMLATHHQAKKFLARYETPELAQSKNLLTDDHIGMNSSFVAKIKEARDAHGQNSRFRWAAQDKRKFLEIVEQIGALNADLRDLVRGKNNQALAAAISSSLLPQITDTLSLVALQQTEHIDPLVKLSAKLKELQYASESGTGAVATIPDYQPFFDEQKAHRKAQFWIGRLRRQNIPQIPAWVEWKIIPKQLNDDDRKTVLASIGGLSSMLSIAKDSEFHTPTCQKLVEDTSHPAGEGRKLGFIFTPPANQTMPDTGPRSLLELFAEFESCPPLLNERFQLAYNLALAMSLMHASRWIHKGFRSENILFCNAADGSTDITRPIVTGFEYSRPESQRSVGDRPTGVPEQDVYYHPDVPLMGFNRVRDCYSLSIVLLEVAMWRPVREMIPESTGRSLGDVGMSEYRAFFLDSMPVLGSTAGASYRDAVRTCLTGDFGVADQTDGNALGRAFFVRVLQKLKYCRA